MTKTLTKILGSIILTTTILTPNYTYSQGLLSRITGSTTMNTTEKQQQRTDRKQCSNTQLTKSQREYIEKKAREKIPYEGDRLIRAGEKVNNYSLSNTLRNKISAINSGVVEDKTKYKTGDSAKIQVGK
jgi:hypothetical protein